MRDIEYQLMSRPVRLHWAGWETDTYRLQEHGWSISAEQDIASMTMMLALRHPHEAAYGISSRVPWEFMEERSFSTHPLDLGADFRFGRDVIVHHMGGLPNFSAIDALPQMMETRRTRLEDFAHFTTPLVRTQEIVVPEESVEDLMARILKLQQPDRTERIRQSLRNPEGYRLDTLPKQKFHAQILSFAA